MISTKKINMEDVLSSSVGYVLSKPARLYHERLSKSLEPLDLSIYEYRSLRLISFAAPMPQGAIGDTYGIDRTTMVDVIDRLEARNLVVREKNQSDRRSYHLRLTPKGRKVLAHASRLTTKLQKDFLSPLSEPEWEAVRSGLLKIISCNQRQANRPIDTHTDTDTSKKSDAVTKTAADINANTSSN